MKSFFKTFLFILANFGLLVFTFSPIAFIFQAETTPEFIGLFFYMAFVVAVNLSVIPLLDSYTSKL